jgi:hypothetical protein
MDNQPSTEDRSMPGAEFHKAVYRSVVIAFAGSSWHRGWPLEAAPELILI